MTRGGHRGHGPSGILPAIAGLTTSPPVGDQTAKPPQARTSRSLPHSPRGATAHSARSASPGQRRGSERGRRKRMGIVINSNREAMNYNIVPWSTVLTRMLTVGCSAAELDAYPYTKPSVQVDAMRCSTKNVSQCCLDD